MRSFNKSSWVCFFLGIFLYNPLAWGGQDDSIIRSEKLIAFIVDRKINKGEQYRRDRILSLIAKGADPSIYIKKYRGSALGNALLLNLNSDIVNILVSNSSDLNSVQYHNKRPIELAVSKKNLAGITALVGRGVDLTSLEGCCFKFKSQPFLSWAVYQKDIQLVKLLLDLGADVNSSNESGDVLTASIVTNQFELVEWFISLGAIGATQPLLHYAIARNAPVEVMQALLSIGFSALSTGTDGTTALEYARNRNNKTAIKLLEKKR